MQTSDDKNDNTSNALDTGDSTDETLIPAPANQKKRKKRISALDGIKTHLTGGTKQWRQCC